MTAPATAITEEASLARSSSVKARRAGLAGDLTSILSKGLAEAPDERYDNVQSFAADLGNWLAGMPVTAKPASLAYRAGKFVRRHRTAVTLTAGAFLALIATTGSAVYQARLARDRYTDVRSSRRVLFSGFIALVQLCSHLRPSLFSQIKTIRRPLRALLRFSYVCEPLCSGQP